MKSRSIVAICAMSLMVLTTVAACDDAGKLSESKAREVIGQPERPIGLYGDPGILQIELVNSPLWTNGEAALLTINNCWASPAEYGAEVASHCPDVLGADLFFSQESNSWYATRVSLIAYTTKIDEIVEILTHDDQATVKYTIGWDEGALFRK